ncbi:MAG: 50S ribosomal protein L17 [Candidatus Latescibacterota bacterium]
MRHRVDHRKLGRTASHRKAMMCNMATSLFEKERITTTAQKAKEARRFAERLITKAKKGYAAYQEGQSLLEAGKKEEAQKQQAIALNQWRLAGRSVRKIKVLKKLFEEIAPQYMERPGGYTRILQTGKRLGDNASTVMLELVGTEITSKPKILKPKSEKEEEETKGKGKGKKAAEPKEDKKVKKAKKDKKEKKPVEVKADEPAEAAVKAAEAEAEPETEAGEDK